MTPIEDISDEDDGIVFKYDISYDKANDEDKFLFGQVTNVPYTDPLYAPFSPNDAEFKQTNEETALLYTYLINDPNYNNNNNNEKFVYSSSPIPMYAQQPTYQPGVANQQIEYHYRLKNDDDDDEIEELPASEDYLDAYFGHASSKTTTTTTTTTAATTTMTRELAPTSETTTLLDTTTIVKSEDDEANNGSTEATVFLLHTSNYIKAKRLAYSTGTQRPKQTC